MRAVLRVTGRSVVPGAHPVQRHARRVASIYVEAQRKLAPTWSKLARAKADADAALARAADVSAASALLPSGSPQRGAARLIAESHANDVLAARRREQATLATLLVELDAGLDRVHAVRQWTLVHVELSRKHAIAELSIVHADCAGPVDELLNSATPKPPAELFADYPGYTKALSAREAITSGLGARS